ncbi:MAG: DUF2723 domain-containing protein, partial [Elusimicrobiota bacterium]
MSRKKTVQQQPIPAPQQGALTWDPLCAGMLALLVYIATLGHSAGGKFGDSLELVAAGASLGVPHAPGYPLYTLLAHLFSFLPIMSVTARVHLLNAVLHAAVAALMVWTAGRLTRSRAGSWAAGLLLAFSTDFWYTSLLADTMALTNLFAMALLALAVSGARWSLPAFFLVLGAAVGHHHTVVLVLPGLAFLLWPKIREQGARPFLWSGLAAVGYALSYGPVIPIALSDPPINWGRMHDFKSFWRLMTRADFGWSMAQFSGKPLTPSDRMIDVGLFFKSVWQGFTPVGAVLAGLGLIRAWKAGREGLAVLAWLVVAGPVFLFYVGLPPMDEADMAMLGRFFFLPALAAAMLAAWGALWMEERARSGSALLRNGVAALLSLCWLLPLGLHWKSVSLRQHHFMDRYLKDLVGSVEPDAIVLASGDGTFFGGYYADVVMGRMGRRIWIDPKKMNFPWYLDELQARWPELKLPPRMGGGIHFSRFKELLGTVLSTGRPVYIIADYLITSPEITDAFSFWPAGLFMRVGR